MAESTIQAQFIVVEYSTSLNITANASVYIGTATCPVGYTLVGGSMEGGIAGLTIGSYTQAGTYLQCRGYSTVNSNNVPIKVKFLCMKI